MAIALRLIPCCCELLGQDEQDVRRRGGFWCSRRSTRAPAGRRRPRLRGHASDRSAIGVVSSTRTAAGLSIARLRTAAASQRRAPGRPRGDHRGRSDAGRSWRRAAADRRSLRMGVRGVPGCRIQQTLSRQLRAMGYRKLSARPRHHAQAPGAIEDLKSSPLGWRRSRARKASQPSAIEVWFADEARSARRTRSPAVGPGAARVRALPRTSEPLPPGISSARSAQGRQGRSVCHGQRHRGDDPAPRRNRHPNRAGRRRRAARRSGRLASRAPALLGSAQHHPDPCCRPNARNSTAGKRLAVHARELALEEALQIVQRHRRPLLRGMEQKNSINQPWWIMSLGLRDWAYRS